MSPGAAGREKLLEVALPLPLHRTFVYRLPDRTAAPPRGGRVVVGFGRRKAVGFVVGEADSAPAGVRVRPVLEVIDAEAILSDTEWAMAEWMARYYVAPLGLVLRLFFPPGATFTVTEGTAAEPARAPERLHVLPTHETSAEDLDRALATLAHAPAQRRAWEAARELTGPVEREEFRRRVDVSPGVLRALAGKGWIRVEPRPVRLDPYPGDALPEPGPEGPLTADQERALSAIRSALGTEEGGILLLQGITGSGKTRIYVEAVAAALEKGGRAIVLVPEIGLAAPTVARFRQRFGEGIAVLHSGLSDGERLDAWRRIRAGSAPVVIGARSALFAPVGRAAVVIVDEEHETAYKQDETPRYSARDVAVYRGTLEGAVVLLGSATPALESRANADAGKYGAVRLASRIGGRPLPEVEVVDLASAELVAPGLSGRLAEALEATLAAGDQSLLFLNRRGFSAFLQCVDCGWVAECPNCRISLTYHQGAPPRLLCHYCAHEAAPPERCPECEGRCLDHRGLGTQQVEAAVAARFPGARIGRMDLDTTGPKGAHARIYRAMRERGLDVLVGTQMIAKGFDLPGVALVGVISADTALHFPDFRATERTFQLLVQVAGRAGRGERPGRVLLQTYLPSHYAVLAAAAHDYEGFYRTEVEFRRGLAYPPARRLANVVVSGPDEGSVEEAIDRVARRLRGRRAALEVVGPAPCPLERLRGRFRHHLLVKSDSAATLERALWDLAERAEGLVGSANRLELDRDPLNLL